MLARIASSAILAAVSAGGGDFGSGRRGFGDLVPDGVENFSERDAAEVAARGDGIVFCCQHQSAAFQQRQFAVEHRRRYVHVVREIRHLPARPARDEALAEQVHRAQRDAFAQRAGGRDLAVTGAQVLGVLHVEAQLPAEQHHQPAQVQPYHEQQHDREAGIDRRRLRRVHGDAREDRADADPRSTAEQRADERRTPAHARVRHVAVQEPEQADDQQVWRVVAAQTRRTGQPRDPCHHGAGLDARQQHHRGNHQDRPDEHDDHVLGHAPGEAARPLDVPGEVERAFDLFDHHDHGVDQDHEADRAEHRRLRVLDELHELDRELDAFLAERPQELGQHGLELAVVAEGLEHRERDGDDRHQREQRRIHEAHGAQAEVAAEQVAQQRVGVAQRRREQVESRGCRSSPASRTASARSGGAARGTG